LRAFNRSKSIEQLEGNIWPQDSFGSHVVQESQRLRKLPVAQLVTEDLRLLIGQKIGLPYVVPVALEMLADNPLASGNFYAGDLLVAILGLPSEFWDAHPELNNEMVELAELVQQLHELIQSELLPGLSRFHYK
jgi:hypothetical protein